MNRRGVTVVELTVVLVVAGIIGAAIGTVLRRQQRFYARAVVVIEQRASARDATGILPAELRSLSPAGGDVLAFSDSALEIRSTIGAGIACDVPAAATAIDLAPAGPTPSGALTAFGTAPQPGDIALVYDGGLPDDSTDDRWVARDVDGVTSRSDACAASPFTVGALDGLPTLRLHLSAASAFAASVTAGAFVHVIRRVRYRLYRASTGHWYLGYAEWDGAGYSVIQPVSGPFAAYSTSATNTGLLLRYFDAEGAPVVAGDAARIARVEVSARGAGATGLSEAPGSSDAQAVTVRARNR